MKLQFVFSFVLFSTVVLGSTIPGFNSIHKQKNAKRDANLIDTIYNNLPLPDTDWINRHLPNLTNSTGNLCTKCKNKLKYAQTLLHQYPEKDHLISLLLYKYCLVLNKNKESKCDNIEFFVTTTSSDSTVKSDYYDGGVNGVTSINFYDNDFLRVIKALNTSSDLDLTYYCYYKNNVCTLPETPDLDKLYDFLSHLPAKPEKALSAPVYNGTRELFNVLHISDFHVQLRYTVGTESNCSATPCCLPESYNPDLNYNDYNFTEGYSILGNTKKDFEYSFYPDAHYADNGTYIKGEYYDLPKGRGYNAESLPASTFGAYYCDAPEVLLNNTLKYIGTITQDKNFELAIFTGDLVDHDVIHCDANTTKTAEIKSSHIMKYFLKLIPVYPTLGNHDTFPYGQLTPASMNYNQSYNWNDELMSKLWINNGWLNETKADFLKNHYSGFSTVTSRGLKVIALNSNCYYQKNLWAYVNLTSNYDIFGQWQFLIDELTESESKGQRVWIMSHIPSSDYDALPIQSAVFQKIVERFSPYTIANIFYGHTHRDQFKILYSSNSTDVSSAIQMAWVSQSVTPDVENNPSWRYYEVEDKSFNIINSYNYYTKLNETFTNGGAEPVWSFEYSARETYDTEGTWPKDAPLNATFWHTYVASKLKNQTDIEFNQLYSNLQYRISPYVPNCKNGTKVSDTCRHENWCDVSSFLSYDYIQCSKN